jgi:ferrous iron transport protein A
MSRKKRRTRNVPLDKDLGPAHTETMLQLSGNKSQIDLSGALTLNSLPAVAPTATLMDLRRGDAAILEQIELPTDDARRLMELGFLPGSRITAGLSAPGGDPRVFQVDGSEIALRRVTARHLKVRFEDSGKATKKP